MAAPPNPAGRFFVMELVRGIPITRFCDDNNLPTRDRLELFIKVCHAIQHAHQKGIIHRDIKPSNVLVTLHDDEAVPAVRRPFAIWGMGFVTAIAIGAQAVRMERAASAPPIPPARLAGIASDELIASAPGIGPADAPVTVIVFADLLCRPCGAALAQLARFQDSHPAGVRLVYRHRPLWFVPGHETSREAAAVGEIAAEHGKFWDFVDAVHKHRGAKDRHAYLQMMRRVGIDAAAVESRLDQAADGAIARVQRDVELAERLGIKGTPSFIVKIGSAAPVSVSQRSLPRLLNSSAANTLLARAARRAAHK